MPKNNNAPKVAIVTGASRGAGKGIAMGLAEKGMTVYVTGRTKHVGKAKGWDGTPLPGTVAETAQACSDAGGTGIGVICDSGDDAQVAQLFEQVMDEQGQVDILMNNAAYIHHQLIEQKPFWDKELDAQNILDVGLRSAYVASCVCSPTRASIMTGKYPGRTDLTIWLGGHGGAPAVDHLSLDEITMASALRESGYLTAMVGKWHLGGEPYWPKQHGFDIAIGEPHAGSPAGGYYLPNRITLPGAKQGDYLTDRLTDEACTFVEEHRDAPFFLYLTHYAVHTPIQAKADLTDRFKAKNPGQHHTNAKYAAMIASVDQSVGRVLDTLETLQLADNTIVLFCSDNGGHSGATSNAPLRGAKGMLYEGGIRVPMIVKWPGVTTAGSVCHEPVLGIDFYPTLLEVTNTPQPAAASLDGASLVPLLRDATSSLSRDSIFWHFPCFLQGKGDPHGGPFRTTPAGAIRQGDWKLIEWFESGRTELYNLKNDLGEQHDLAATNPDQAAKLLADLRAWRDEVNAPVPSVKNPKYSP